MPLPQSAAVSPSLEPMLADIRRQPQVLAGLLARRDEIAAFAQNALTPDAGGRLYAFGSGDGWFASRAAFGGTGASGVSGLYFLLNTAPALGARDRAIGISMSGNVDRTLEAAEAALAAGAKVSLLTNGMGGRIGALGLARFSLDIPDLAPFLCGTSSYVATLTVLAMAAQGNDWADELDALVGDLPRFIEETHALFGGAAAGLASCSGVRFLGVGTSVATADYGAAKCVEVTTVPAWSDDIEEFAHRQYWSMKRDEIVVLLPVDARSAAYADATAEALSHLDMQVVAIEPADAPVPEARHRITLPGHPRHAPLTQAVALQLFAYHLGIANGTDPNRRLHLKQDETRFSVSRRLTRRSLIGTGH